MGARALAGRGARLWCRSGTLGGGGWKEAHGREYSGECDRNGMKMY